MAFYSIHIHVLMPMDQL